MSGNLGKAVRNAVRGISRAAMILLVLVGLVPKLDAHTNTRSSVNDRVGRIRVALRERLQPTAELAGRGEESSVKLAQWGNAWTNWNNWNNWRNWSNWGNWGNWANW